ncbi:heat shock protein HspQ [Acinetobacter baumannii]
MLAENADSTYVAYVSEQNLLPDDTGEPVRHPEVARLFGELKGGFYLLRAPMGH